jgi:hypothetical protein
MNTLSAPLVAAEGECFVGRTEKGSQTSKNRRKSKIPEHGIGGNTKREHYLGEHGGNMRGRSSNGAAGRFGLDDRDPDFGEKRKGTKSSTKPMHSSAK